MSGKHDDSGGGGRHGYHDQESLQDFLRRVGHQAEADRPVALGLISLAKQADVDQPAHERVGQEIKEIAAGFGRHVVETQGFLGPAVRDHTRDFEREQHPRGGRRTEGRADAGLYQRDR